MEYETIQFTVKDQVARITFNRPDAANALNSVMGKELMDVAIRCDEDPEVRAVLLTGTGKMFCAGGDLREFARLGDRLPIAFKELTTYCHAATSRLMRMKAPVITAVNGVAAGMGMSLAICGDIIIAAESAAFVAAYTAAGLSPDGGMTYFLPRLIGQSRTKELLLTNRKLTAQEALEWGIVNRVVPDADLMKETESLARSLASGPTRAFGTVRGLLNDTFSQTLETQMELEARGIAEMAKTKDARGGIQAFVEKQRPVYIGQ